MPHEYSPFPLSSGSRSRRRLAMIQAAACQADAIDAAAAIADTEEPVEPSSLEESVETGPVVAIVAEPRVVGRKALRRPVGDARGHEGLGPAVPLSRGREDLPATLPSRGHEDSGPATPCARGDEDAGVATPQAKKSAGRGVRRVAASPTETPVEAGADDREQAQKFPPVDRFSPGLQEIRRLLDGSRPVTWVFTGDAITHGARYTSGRRSYSEHFAERIRWELRRLLDVVINTGVIGEHSQSLLKNLEWRALRFRPDVVSVLVGLNDCKAGPDGRNQFRDNLEMIVSALREGGAAVLLNTPNSIPESNAGKYADLPAYVEIVAQVAAEREVAFVDHWSYWRQVNPDEANLAKWLADDQIHPGVFGHRAMSNLLFKTLGIFDLRSPTCAVRLP